MKNLFIIISRGFKGHIHGARHAHIHGGGLKGYMRAREAYLRDNAAPLGDGSVMTPFGEGPRHPLP